MWFDACLCLQNHAQMPPCDSFSLDSVRYPGMADGTQPAGRARDGNVAILTLIKCGDAFWVRLKVT